MNKIICPRSGLAQEWAPRLRTTFIVLLVLTILFCSLPVASFASSSSESYYYNGVPLPALPFDSIPEQYFIVQTASGYYRLFGTISSGSNLYIEPNTTYGQIIRYKVGDSYGALDYYQLEDSVWVQQNNSGGVVFSSIVFSNTDILYENSTDVFYSANSAALPYSQKDIYSYNDLIAPSIFDFTSDMSNYPYHYIFMDKDTYTYYACVCWTELSVKYYSSNSSYYFSMSGASPTDIYYPYYKGELVDGVWSITPYTGSIIYYLSDYELVWASTDVLYESDDSLYFEGSDAVPLGIETSLFTVMPEDDVYSVKQGGSKRFEVASSQGLEVSTVTWQVKGNVSTGTSIDYTGLLTVSDTQSLEDIYVVASDINGNGYSSNCRISVESAQTPSTTYTVQPASASTTYYAGNSYQFYCLDSSGSAASSVTWSIYSNYIPIASGTSISSAGLLTIASDQNVGNITIQASNINGTTTYSSYDITVFMSGSGGGDTPTVTPTPGTQDVIDSVDDGFTNLENKLEDTGNNIINGLLEGLLRLFVPTSEELSQKMDDFKSWIDEKIPILAVPVALVQYTYDMFFGVTPELGVLTFPEIKWMDNVLIQETELNLGQYSWLSDLLPIIRTVMTAGCCLAFVHWIISKVKEVGKS